MSKTEDGQTECIYMCHGQVCTGTAAARAKKGLGTESICKVPIIPSWKLQMMAYEVFHACLQDVDTVFELAQGMLEKHINDRAERKGSPAREMEIREEIDELKKRIDRCTELRIDNEISNELFKKKKQEYEIRISDLKSELDELCGSEEGLIDESAPVVDRIKMLVSRLRQEIVDQDDGGVNIPAEVIEAFVDHIIVHESSFDWYLRCTGNDEWDDVIYDSLDSDLSKHKRRSSKGYYGYMPGRGKQKNNSIDDIYEEFHGDRPKATEIMTFVLMREHANTFRENQGKNARKIRWSDITVKVFL